MKKVILPMLAAAALVWSIPAANAVTYVCADIYCTSVKPVGPTIGPSKKPSNGGQVVKPKPLSRTR